MNLSTGECETDKDFLDHDEQADMFRSKLTPESDLFYACVMLILVLFGMLGNGVGIYIFSRRKKQLTPAELIIFILCILNFLIAVTCSFSIPSALNHEWVWGDLGCTILGAILCLWGFSHLTSLVTLAVIRYWQICKVGNCISRRFISMVYLFPLSLALFPLSNRVGSYGVEPYGLFCCLKWYKADLGSRAYAVTICILLLLLPAAIMTFCYTRIAKKVNKTKATLGEMSAVPEMWVTKLIVCMGLAFAISWALYGLCIVYTGVFGELLIPVELSPIPVLLATSSTLSTPVIHVLLNRKYRNELLSLLNLTIPGVSISIPLSNSFATSAAYHHHHNGNGNGVKQNGIVRSPSSVDT